jgi:hypothetical protein
MTYIHTVQVTGSVRTKFPVDMLRYDCCFPCSALDASLIERSGDITNPAVIASIRVSKHSTDKDPRWTDGRWKSFGWTVDRDSMHTHKI